VRRGILEKLSGGEPLSQKCILGFQISGLPLKFGAFRGHP